MSFFKEDETIKGCTIERAIKEGMLVEIFKNRWSMLSEGKPIVATAHLFDEVSLAGLMEIWFEFVGWRKRVFPTLAEEDEELFSTTMNDKKVYVVEWCGVFILMYQED